MIEGEGEGEGEGEPGRCRCARAAPALFTSWRGGSADQWIAGSADHSKTNGPGDCGASAVQVIVMPKIVIFSEPP